MRNFVLIFKMEVKTPITLKLHSIYVTTAENSGELSLPQTYLRSIFQANEYITY